MGETLTLLSLHDIEQEPELLRVDGERIRRQMQEVAVGHYRAFISAADAVQNITHEITAVDEHLKALIAEIPKLITGCNDFMEDAQQILEKRQLNRTLLANHSSLLDLLEIPQLMDACVRNGNYDEALDLEAFVSKLAMMHSRLPVIQSLEADVRQTTQSLLAQILQRLRSSIPLPECLRVIGYLRRLAVFNEHEIRLQFLRCREAWLVGIIDDLDQSNPYEYLKRMADYHRVHLFDVVMQYRAIFSDDTSGHEENTDGGLLYSWAMHRISSHLSVLRDVLPQITEGPNLAIILDQCMYCGMSLGRVGLDFRGLLPPLFESSVHDLFVRNMSVTVNNFQHVLDSHRWVPLPPVTLGRGTSSLDHSPDDVAPPYSIMEYPPLAAFVNGVLAALNELRHCAPINLKATLALELQCALQSVANSLLRYNTTRIVKDSERTLFLAMCRAFIEVVCPYCTLCFGKCCSGGSALIQTNEVLEGVRKLVSTQTSFPKEIRNGSRSLDLNQLPQDLPPSVANSEAANARSRDANGHGIITENGHGGSLLEEGVEVETTAVVDEPRQAQTPDSNLSTDSQNVEPRARASGGHLSETSERAVGLQPRVSMIRSNAALVNGSPNSVHPRPDSVRSRGTRDWYPFGIGTRLRWAPTWAGYPLGLSTMLGVLRTGLGLISVPRGVSHGLQPGLCRYPVGVHTRVGRASIWSGYPFRAGSCMGLVRVCDTYAPRIGAHLDVRSVPVEGRHTCGEDAYSKLLPVSRSMSGENFTKSIFVGRNYFDHMNVTYSRVPIEVLLSKFGSRFIPRRISEVAFIPSSQQGVLL